MAKAESSKPQPLAPQVSGRIVVALDSYLSGERAPAEAFRAAAHILAAQDLTDAEAVLKGRDLSYRDGLLIQLAWGLSSPDGYDHTQRGIGARTVSQALGKANAARHIPKVNDAYENIGKNSPNLARGNFPGFDRLLHWMNAATRSEREALFDYAAATVASSARPVSPMPVLRPAELTFGRTISFLDDLLSRPSGGAHEQFAVAAFLGALIDQFGLSGVGALNVRTKNINAADASAGTAADVQIMRGGMIEEVFEVSANDWPSKLDQAVQAARRAGLARAHIVAEGGGIEALSELLKDTTVDVSVVGTRELLRVVCSALRPPQREDALRRLYDYIDGLQSDVALTNRYVELLRGHALTA